MLFVVDVMFGVDCCSLLVVWLIVVRCALLVVRHMLYVYVCLFVVDCSPCAV